MQGATRVDKVTLIKGAKNQACLLYTSTGLLLLAGMMVTVQRLTGLKKTDGVD